MSKTDQDLNINIPPDLLKELLTESEWRMIKQRLAIIQLLGRGFSIRTIAETVKVGTDTVMRMARKFEENPKLQKEFKSYTNSTSPSKWVFGQVGGEEDL